MIDYYTAKSLGGNTRKITIMLAETGLEHVVNFVDLDKSEQYEPWYRAINPNCKIPAIVDHDVPGGLAFGESGAILIYLAEKTGRFLPVSGPDRARVMQWVFWQVGSVGPMAGQLSYFAGRAPEKIDFAINRYRDECGRLLDVLEGQLSGTEYIAGDYSIADMANYSWIKPLYESFMRAKRPSRVTDLTHIPRWIATMSTRPAVTIAMTKFEGTALRVGKDVEAPLA
ncbi:GST-like protein [Rhizobiales bacterium GAS113]|jgi:GST-like protein|nr:GST-like protein [Rhizobiales bacterium GAS113]